MMIAGKGAFGAGGTSVPEALIAARAERESDTPGMPVGTRTAGMHGEDAIASRRQLNSADRVQMFGDGACGDGACKLLSSGACELIDSGGSLELEPDTHLPNLTLPDTSSALPDTPNFSNAHIPEKVRECCSTTSLIGLTPVQVTKQALPGNVPRDPAESGRAGTVDQCRLSEGVISTSLGTCVAENGSESGQRCD